MSKLERKARWLQSREVLNTRLDFWLTCRTFNLKTSWKRADLKYCEWGAWRGDKKRCIVGQEFDQFTSNESEGPILLWKNIWQTAGWQPDRVPWERGAIPPTLSREEAPLSHLFQLWALNLCPHCWAWWHKGFRSGLVGAWEEAHLPCWKIRDPRRAGCFFKYPLLLGWPRQSWGIGRKASANPPLLQATGTTHNMSLLKPSWPGSEFPYRAHFHSGRERSSEQGHSNWETQAVPALDQTTRGPPLPGFSLLVQGEAVTTTPVGLHQRTSERPGTNTPTCQIQQQKSKIQWASQIADPKHL